MPSRLRFLTDFDPITTGTIRPVASSPPQKKQKMSLTQTYFIASSARSKLGREACKPDHDLRLLVGHANLLDSLMLELQDAEREQEAWFNSSVQKAERIEETPKHIRWADTIIEEPEPEDSESDSDSDFDEEDFDMLSQARNIRQAPVIVSSRNDYLDAYDDDDVHMYPDEDEDAPELALVRTQSRSASPPELIDDSDDSEDDSPPASPPQPNFDFDLLRDKQQASSIQEAMLEEGFYIPQRHDAPMIAAF